MAPHDHHENLAARTPGVSRALTLTLRIAAHILILSSIHLAQSQAVVAPATASGQVAAHPSQEISGVVVSSRTGQPLANASVELTWTNDRTPLAESITDAEGRFSFPSLRNGKYSLSAKRRGFLAAAFDEHPSGSTAIVVGPEQKTIGLRFQLQPISAIYGTVTEDSGDPVPAARVAVCRLILAGNHGCNGKTGPVRQTNADEMGYFEISNLAPGLYLVSVSGRPWYASDPANKSSGNTPRSESGKPQGPLDVAYRPVYFPGTTDAAFATPIEVGGGERVPVNLTLHPEPAIHVTIHLPASSRNPMIVPNVTQNIFGLPANVGGNIQMPLVDAQGNRGNAVEITGLAQGQYELTLSGVTGESSRELSVNLASDQIIEATAANPLSQVSGKITLIGEDGTPIPTPGQPPARNGNGNEFRQSRNLVVVLAGSDGESRYTGQVDAAGSFRIPSVRPGSYEVSAYGQGLPQTVIELLASGGSVEGHQLQVGTEPVLLTARVADSTSTVHGFVTLHGKAASGVFLELIPMDARGGAVLSSTAVQTNQSDSDGSFDFPNVPAGAYTVIAVLEGWTLDPTDADSVRPYLAHGMPVKVPARRRDVVLKESVEAQAK